MKTITQSLAVMTLCTGAALASLPYEETERLDAKSLIQKALFEVRQDIRSLKQGLEETQQDRLEFKVVLKSADARAKNRAWLAQQLQQMDHAEKFMLDDLREKRGHEKKLKKFKIQLTRMETSGLALDQDTLKSMLAALGEMDLLDHVGTGFVDGDATTNSPWLNKGLMTLQQTLGHPVVATGLLLSTQVMGVAASLGPISSKQAQANLKSAFSLLRRARDLQCPPSRGDEFKHRILNPIEISVQGTTEDMVLKQHYEISYAHSTRLSLELNPYCPAGTHRPENRAHTDPLNTVWTFASFREAQFNQKESRETLYEYNYLRNAPRCIGFKMSIDVNPQIPSCVASGAVQEALERCWIRYDCPLPAGTFPSQHMDDAKPIALEEGKHASISVRIHSDQLDAVPALVNEAYHGLIDRVQ